MMLSPYYQGDTLYPLTVTFLTDSGNALALVNTPTFSLKLVEVDSHAVIVGAGSWQVLDSNGGIAQYSWNTADVAMAGIYELWIAATVNGKTGHADPELITILAVP
jgi:hypothetical protein